MKKNIRLAALIMAAVMMVPTFAGCSGKAEKPVYLPKTITYYDEDGALELKSENEYDPKGNPTVEKSFVPDEKGELVLSYFLEMVYDKDGNLVDYKSYNADAEEPYVDFEIKSIYENGLEIKSENYDFKDGALVLTSYYDYEYDSAKRTSKNIYYRLNEETGEFEKSSESVFSYEGDSELPISIDIEVFVDDSFMTSGSTKNEYDEKGRVIVSETLSDNYGMKTVTEYSGELISKELNYVFDFEADEWALKYTSTYTYNSKGNVTEIIGTYESGTVYKDVSEYDESGEKLLKELNYVSDEDTDGFELYGYAVYEY